MPNFAILGPMTALGFLTFAVWVTMFARRIPYLRGKDLDTMAVRDARPVAPAWVAAPNDNLLNLFELPVLFYVLCLALALTGRGDDAMLFAAWVYVALRVAHSIVHCTYNKVLHRFVAYFLSTLVLFGMWVGFALGL